MQLLEMFPRPIKEKYRKQHTLQKKGPNLSYENLIVWENFQI